MGKIKVYHVPVDLLVVADDVRDAARKVKKFVYSLSFPPHTIKLIRPRYSEIEFFKEVDEDKVFIELLEEEAPAYYSLTGELW